MPERPMGADCKSAGVCLRWFESIPAHPVSRKFVWEPKVVVQSVRAVRTTGNQTSRTRPATEAVGPDEPWHGGA